MRWYVGLISVHVYMVVRTRNMLRDPYCATDACRCHTALECGQAKLFDLWVRQAFLRVCRCDILADFYFVKTILLTTVHGAALQFFVEKETALRQQVERII